jgi:hypothetical protein
MIFLLFYHSTPSPMHTYSSLSLLQLVCQPLFPSLASSDIILYLNQPIVHLIITYRPDQKSWALLFRKRASCLASSIISSFYSTLAYNGQAVSNTYSRGKSHFKTSASTISHSTCLGFWRSYSTCTWVNLKLGKTLNSLILLWPS